MSENNSSEKQLTEALEELTEALNESLDTYDNESMEWWDNLSYDDKCMAFYVVTKKIMDAELKGSSYRGVLYSEFGFGSDMYSIGMKSGFFDLHNMLAEYFRQKK